MVGASIRAITSYGPVTSSAIVTPLIWAISVAIAEARPTSVWIKNVSLHHHEVLLSGLPEGNGATVRTTSDIERSRYRVGRSSERWVLCSCAR